MQNGIVIAPMTDDLYARHQTISQRCAALIEQGICPSCRQFSHGDVFPDQDAQTYYQDELVSVQLEVFPRGVGHTILLTKTHYADIADVPIDVSCYVAQITHAAVNSLKQIIGAEKVYLVSMCSGNISHFHLQLIPRLKGEMIGGRVFASPRGVLTSFEGTKAALGDAMDRRIRS